MAAAQSLRLLFLFLFFIAFVAGHGTLANNLPRPDQDDQHDGNGSSSSSTAAARPNGFGQTWCVARTASPPQKLQANIQFACSVAGVDCRAIKPGGACFNPNTVQNHASYAMNAYYQHAGRHAYNCDFGGTGQISVTDPSWRNCRYPA